MAKSFVDQEPALTDHLRIIYKIAWGLHKSTGHDLEDLFSEGCLQYLVKQREFDRAREVRFTSFIWTSVRNMLLNYIRDNDKLVLVEFPDYLYYLEEFPVGAQYQKHRLKDVFEHKAF